MPSRSHTSASIRKKSVHWIPIPSEKNRCLRVSLYDLANIWSQNADFILLWRLKRGNRDSLLLFWELIWCFFYIGGLCRVNACALPCGDDIEFILLSLSLNGLFAKLNFKCSMQKRERDTGMESQNNQNTIASFPYTLSLYFALFFAHRLLTLLVM